MSITIKDTSATSPMIQRMLGSGPGMAPALPNYPAQSVTAIDGIRSALFGTPFLAAGGFIWYMTFHGDPRARHAPVWLIFLIGGIFFSGGLFLFLHGIAGMIRRAVHSRRAVLNPGQPWLSDFHWRPEGIRFSAFQAMMGRLLAALGWYLFLAPFFWVGTHGPWPFLAVAAFFGLLGIMFWVRWAQMLGDLLRYGNSFLAYDSFPYFLGSTLHARLRAPRHLSLLNSLTLTLRCIQERYVTTGTGRDRSTRVVCYELYKDSVSLDQLRLANFSGGDIPVEFRLPADKPCTTLDDAPPTYWSIEARGEAPGADYEAYFLVPVYKAS